MNKNYFYFGFFDGLKVGDVFKFSPTINNDIPSKFYTVIAKDKTTKICTTYGKMQHFEFNNLIDREVMIFENRKRILNN